LNPQDDVMGYGPLGVEDDYRSIGPRRIDLTDKDDNMLCFLSEPVEIARPREYAKRPWYVRIHFIAGSFSDCAYIILSGPHPLFAPHGHADLLGEILSRWDFRLHQGCMGEVTP